MRSAIRAVSRKIRAWASRHGVRRVCLGAAAAPSAHDRPRRSTRLVSSRTRTRPVAPLLQLLFTVMAVVALQLVTTQGSPTAPSRPGALFAGGRGAGRADGHVRTIDGPSRAGGDPDRRHPARSGGGSRGRGGDPRPPPPVRRRRRPPIRAVRAAGRPGHGLGLRRRPGVPGAPAARASRSNAPATPRGRRPWAALEEAAGVPVRGSSPSRGPPAGLHESGASNSYVITGVADRPSVARGVP